MNPRSPLRRASLLRRLPALASAALALGLPLTATAQTVPAAPVSAGPVEALVYSTLPSTAAHRPEMALDGDPQTFFQTASGMDDGDDFWVIFSRAVPVSALRVVTGDADGQDTLSGGILETSPDAVHYTQAATFDANGVASAPGKRSVRAIRIRLSAGQNVPTLLLREISMTSTVPIARTLLGPGRGFVDYSQAPDVAAWAQKAEVQMEQSWADTAALLYTDKFLTPNAVNVVYRSGEGVTDIAATGGGVMTVNPAWCRAHPTDTPLTVHETAHVIQAYTAYNPVWLVEGIADYVRWVKFEPQNFHPRINPEKSTYHDAYQTTATFLSWCELHYDSRLVSKLSENVRFGTYQNALFKTYCGKDVDTLWSEFVADYKVHPNTIITPAVAAADLPRTLPVVAPGSGVPVGLAAAFNTPGISTDGKSFSATGGLDSGGTGYSAKLLGETQTWQGVPFGIGAPGVPDAVSSRGQVVPLPAGKYAGLWLLGSAINGTQKAQVMTVTYDDGTTASLVQSFSDWFQPGRFPGESRAVKMPYRNLASGAQDPRPFYAYSYGFALDPAKTVKSLTLPNNDSVKILAVTLTK